ncbi:MAG: NAD(P)-dependent oxidoreductase [Actinomycetota bacterium]|nr:NAD(P)-dependent oxidoreductase [Actinomycetota bacterium]
MRVGIAGLGKMGSALARRLLSDGHEVTVWNRTRERAAPLIEAGASLAGSLGELAGGAEQLCTLLSDDDAALAVYLGPDGLIAHGREGQLLIDMSTISPAASAQIAAAAAGRARRFVRCPVSGNPGVLLAGNLGLIASGDPADFAAARPLLERVGAKVFFVGEGEAARVVKLAVNAVLAATTELLAETIVLCEANGIGRARYLEVLSASAVGSPLIAYKRDALVARDYDATFTTAMLGKDLGLVLDAAGAAGVAMPVSTLLAALVNDACRQGYADLDFLALLPQLQGLSGRERDR